MARETREIKRLMIRGVVQGIGYRAWSEREALALGLKGWVRNRVDGSVEMVLAGAPDQITAMIEHRACAAQSGLRPNTSPNSRCSAASTSGIDTGCPRSAKLVTP